MSPPPPTGWRPIPPPPPVDTNGWGRYVAATLEHVLVRLHYIEKHHDQCSLRLLASDAHTTKEPSDQDVWKERKEVAKEIGTGLKWLAAIVLLIGLILKRIEVSQLPMLKSWLGIGG